MVYCKDNSNEAVRFGDLSSPTGRLLTRHPHSTCLSTAAVYLYHTEAASQVQRANWSTARHSHPEIFVTHLSACNALSTLLSIEFSSCRSGSGRTRFPAFFSS